MLSAYGVYFNAVYGLKRKIIPSRNKVKLVKKTNRMTEEKKTKKMAKESIMV